MNYKITADSTCDLSCEQAERYSIGILPLYVQLGDRTYQDGVDIFPDDIYQHISAGGALATTAARNGMTLIEPTGGIDLDNFSVILKTCLEAGVPRIMPHVYSSIIDPDTGYTRPDDVAVLLNKVKSLL